MQRVVIWLLAALVLLIVPPPSARAESGEQAILTELFTLNRSLQELRSRIGYLQGEAEQAAREEARLEAERARLEERRRERQALFGQRARFYSERGSLAPIGVLLSAGSFPAFLERLELLTFVMRRDAELISELRELRARAEEQERLAAGRRAEAVRLREAAQAEERRLAAEIARREQMLEGLQGERAAVEAKLDALEQIWERAAMPVLEALGEAMLAMDMAGFTPDSVSISLLPPGANIRISERGLNRFIGASPALANLAFRVAPGEVVLEGEYQGVPIRVTGGFTVVGRTLLRYEPRAMAVDGFAIPRSVTEGLLAEGRFDLDLTDQVRPFALQEVRMLKGEIIIRAALR